MVAPVTSVVLIPVSTAIAYVDLRYDRQKRPYTLSLRMDCRRHRSTPSLPAYNSLPANYSYSFENISASMPNKPLVFAFNRSYAKMVGELGDASQMGSTLTAERRETWSTAVTILTRVLRAAREVKRLNLFAAARELGLPYREFTKTQSWAEVRPSRDGRYFKVRHRIKRTYFSYGTRREYLKTVGNGWLMWSYGVKPLMEDLYNCMDVLQRPFPWKRISGRATEKSSLRQEQKPPMYFHNLYEIDYKVSVRQSVAVRVANPNLWLANRLGLVNPVQMINEAIPFSFVVDWFSNLSNVINSLTDFVGLETNDPVVNIGCTVLESKWYARTPWDPENTTSRYNRYTQRRLGLVLPRIRFAYERFQWQRGANAISLLLGLLPKSTKR